METRVFHGVSWPLCWFGNWAILLLSSSILLVIWTTSLLCCSPVVAQPPRLFIFPFRSSRFLGAQWYTPHRLAWSEIVSGNFENFTYKNPPVSDTFPLVKHLAKRWILVIDSQAARWGSLDFHKGVTHSLLPSIHPSLLELLLPLSSLWAPREPGCHSHCQLKWSNLAPDHGSTAVRTCELQLGHPPEHMTERMSEYLPERMPERMSEQMPVCQIECQIECQSKCQKEWQIECQKYMPHIHPDDMSKTMSE